jgi:hypothetical protein
MCVREWGCVGGCGDGDARVYACMHMGAGMGTGVGTGAGGPWAWVVENVIKGLYVVSISIVLLT